MNSVTARCGYSVFSGGGNSFVGFKLKGMEWGVMTRGTGQGNPIT